MRLDYHLPFSPLNTWKYQGYRNTTCSVQSIQYIGFQIFWKKLGFVNSTIIVLSLSILTVQALNIKSDLAYMT